MIHPMDISFFFFNDTATTEIYTLSLHDALPIYHRPWLLQRVRRHRPPGRGRPGQVVDQAAHPGGEHQHGRSEEHTSELQSRQYLVCRLLLEKKKQTHRISQNNTLLTFLPELNS